MSSFRKTWKENVLWTDCCFCAWICKFCQRGCECMLTFFCSIQILISLMFAVSLITLGTLIIVLSQVYSTRNVDDIFQQTQRVSIHHIEVLTKNWLAASSTIMDYTHNYLRSKDNDPNFDIHLLTETSVGMESSFELGLFFYGMIYTTENLVDVCFASEMGGAVCAIDMGGMIGGAFTNTSLQPDECCPYTFEDLFTGASDELPGPGYMYIINDADLSVSDPFVALPFYDPRVSSWYMSGMSTSERFWSYEVNIANIMQFVLVERFLDSEGEVVGVAVLSYYEEGILGFLDDLNIERGMIYLFLEDGTLVGSSDVTVDAFTIDSETSLKKTVHCSEVCDVVVRESYDHILTHHYSEANGFDDHVQTETVKIAGDLYYLEAKKVESGVAGMSIMVSYVTKSDDIFGDIRAGNIASILICTSFIVVVVLSSICGICCILRPLNSLSKKMKKVENMDLEKINFRCFSVFREIRNVEKRFKYCVEKLIEYSAFLPDYILNDLEKESDNDRCGTSTLSSSSGGRSVGVDSRINNEGGVDGTDPDGTGPEAGHEGRNQPIPRREGSFSSVSTISSGYDMSTKTALSSSKRDKFGLGVERKMVVCVYLYLLNWRVIFNQDQEAFIGHYSKFHEYIVNVTKRFSFLYYFDVDRIILYYPRESLKIAILHVSKISSAIKSEAYMFHCAMGISLESSIIGVIGHRRHRKNCASDGAVEKCKFMIDNYLRTEKMQRQIQEYRDRKSIAKEHYVHILVEYLAFTQIRYNNILKSVLRSSPLDIFYDYFGPMGAIPVFQVSVDDSVVKECTNEWMYKYNREKKVEQSEFFLSSFLCLLDGDVRRSKQYASLSLRSRALDTPSNAGDSLLDVYALLSVIRWIEEESGRDFQMFLDGQKEVMGENFKLGGFDKSLFFARPFCEINQKEKSETEEEEESVEDEEEGEQVEVIEVEDDALRGDVEGNGNLFFLGDDDVDGCGD